MLLINMSLEKWLFVVEIAIISLICAVFIYCLLLMISGSKKSAVGDRLSKLFIKETNISASEEVILEKLRKTRAKRDKKLSSAKRRLDNYLFQAGIKLKTSEFIIIWAVSTAVLVLIFFSIHHSIVTLIGALAVGIAVPPMVVKRARTKRSFLFNKQLCEGLGLIGNCIKSGYSFRQAMEGVAKDLPAPISTEFARALREMQFGVRQDEALRHMNDRMQDKDLDLLVSAIVISSQVGGNLSEILDTIASTINDRIKIREEIRIMTSSGRISGIIIGLLPLAIFLLLMLINPGYILDFLKSSLSGKLLAVAAVLELIGFMAVNKIVNIKY